MELALLIAILVLSASILAFLFWLLAVYLAGRRQLAGQATAVSLLQQQLDSVRVAQNSTRDTLERTLQAGQENISRSLRSSQEVLSALNNQVGQLQGTNKQMLQVSVQVQRLQEILSSPKLRGQMGEYSLENLLAKILPKDTYKLQYTLRDGQKIDALVELADFCVPVDAKFPLSAFEALSGADGEQAKPLRRQFLKDLKIHVDKIASAYIRPAEGTVDFALMYIPAENIYYETIINYSGEDWNILAYALEKRVIPVSPNLLYAYLMTVAMGLHGLRIGEQAAEIGRNLKKLEAFLTDFTGDWDVLGTHLRNAYGKYEDGQKKLDRFGLHLGQITAQAAEAELGEVSKAVSH
jgi:DNA recombination protein RmuC